MATTSVQSSKLVVVFDAGTNENGVMVTKSKQIASVNPEAAADALWQTAEAYAALTKPAVVRTERRDVLTIEA